MIATIANCCTFRVSSCSEALWPLLLCHLRSSVEMAHQQEQLTMLLHSRHLQHYCLWLVSIMQFELYCRHMNMNWVSDSETRTRLHSALTSSLSVRRTRLAIELFRSPPLVPRTISRLHHLCQFSAVTWRHISSDVLCHDFCSACEVAVIIIGHFNRSSYLLTNIRLSPNNIIWSEGRDNLLLGR